jgi:hypothetical protein
MCSEDGEVQAARVNDNEGGGVYIYIKRETAYMRHEAWH